MRILSDKKLRKIVDSAKKNGEAQAKLLYIRRLTSLREETDLRLMELKYSIKKAGNEAREQCEEEINTLKALYLEEKEKNEKLWRALYAMKGAKRK